MELSQVVIIIGEVIILAYITVFFRRITRMSANATDVQKDMDTVTAFITSTVPQLVKLTNDLFTEVQTLRAGGQPTLDVNQVAADLVAIHAAVDGLPQVITNDTPLPTTTTPATGSSTPPTT